VEAPRRSVVRHQLLEAAGHRSVVEKWLNECNGTSMLTCALEAFDSLLVLSSIPSINQLILYNYSILDIS